VGRSSSRRTSGGSCWWLVPQATNNAKKPGDSFVETKIDRRRTKGLRAITNLGRCDDSVERRAPTSK